MGKELCEQKERAKIMCFTHGNPTPVVYEYGNVQSEEHFMNMMAGALIIGHEDGTFTDKAMGYYNDTWYHAVPSCEEEDDEPIQKGIPIRCNACGSTDLEEYDQDTISCQECGNIQLLEGVE